MISIRNVVIGAVGTLVLPSCGGADGSTTLVRLGVEPPGANCAEGGTAIETGLDADGDATLDDAEVTSTAYVCRGGAGAAGPVTLVRLDAEPSGANCVNGGTAVHAGVDADEDGVLDAVEVSSTSYVCSGVNALLRTDPEDPGSHCAAGGTAVHAGLDSDGDGVLDDTEITSTSYVCEPYFAPKEAILVLQPGFDSFFDPAFVSLVDRDSRSVLWSKDLQGPAEAVVRDPDGSTFWVSVPGIGVQHRTLSDGLLVGTVAYPSAKDMVVVPSLSRIYVGGYESVGVINTGTDALMATIPLQSGDQTLGIAASPDGSEVVLGAYLGTHDLVFLSTGTNSVTQRLAAANTFADIMHFGSRVITWDDNRDELRAYAPGPWTEISGTVVTLGSDGGSSFNALHNMQYDSTDGRIYIFRALAAEVLRIDPFATTAYSVITLAKSYMCMSIDLDGLGLLGFTYPATTSPMHLSLPGGTEGPSMFDTSTLPLGTCTQLENVSYSAFTTGP